METPGYKINKLQGDTVQPREHSQEFMTLNGVRSAKILNRYTVHLKLIQNCTSITLQLKKKNPSLPPLWDEDSTGLTFRKCSGVPTLMLNKHNLVKPYNKGRYSSVPISALSVNALGENTKLKLFYL